MSISKCVVVVDDVESVRLSLVGLLGAWGYSVQAYESAEEALSEREILAQAGCMILDYKLPGLNGLELLTALKSHSISIPTIVVSGTVCDLNAEHLRAAGVADVLAKPIPGNVLIGHVERLLNLA